MENRAGAEQPLPSHNAHNYLQAWLLVLVCGLGFFFFFPLFFFFPFFSFFLVGFVFWGTFVGLVFFSLILVYGLGFFVVVVFIYLFFY